jgi:uncharacterized protein (DUF885 family)
MTQATESAAAFGKLIDDYVAATNAWQPAVATARGFHEHDARLGDRSEAAIAGRMRDVARFLDRLAVIDADAIGAEAPYEADLLRRRLQWELTENERLRAWQRGPGGYLGTIGGACNGLMIRNFAPPADRLRALASRLRAVPALLVQAKENLLDPSRYHVDTATEQVAGIRMLLARDLPAWAATAGDETLRQEFAEANNAAVQAVDNFADWMKSDLAPRANDNFAWGADTMMKLLGATDSIDEPLDVLVKRGEEDLRAHQERLREVAAKIDASSSPAEVVDRVSREHPSPDQLLPEVEKLLESLRQFCIDAKLCTMPTDVRIAVTETPGFARMTTQAACSTPGPFETVAKEAYYYVTPADPSWPPERIESYMKFFNRHSIAGVSAHEAYPGHYVHLTYLHRAKSVLGRYLMSMSAIEGWAHYIEQVMVEAGYDGGDPRFELMQIREALLRLARYRCAFGLHAEGWTVEQGVEFFEKEGFATRIIAERETRRGVIGPNYYAYTMGKHQILALRDKLRARDGASFELRAFHDAFMQLPYPVTSIETIMLGA